MSDTTSATDASAITIYETTTIRSSPVTGTMSTSSAASTISTSRTIVTAASTPTYLLGPLTTTYTAPTNCSQAYWYSASDNVYDPMLGQTCARGSSGQISFTNENDCLPPVTKSTVIGSLVGDSTILSTSTQYVGYYSPGIACPAGYTSICAVQAGADGIQSALTGFQSFSFVYTATADETVVGCCPTGYACANVASTQMCQKIIPTTTQSLITCVNVSNSASASTTQLTLPTITTLFLTDTQLSTETTSIINLTTLSMLATMVQINFQTSDLLATSSSSLSSSSATATGASGSSGSNHKTTTIAVATVIPCVAALAAAGLIWFWYQRRAKKRASYLAAPPTEPLEMYQSTEPSGIYYASGVPTEISGDQARFEIAGTTPQYEMEGSDTRKVAHEMDAGDEVLRSRDNDEDHNGLK